MAASTLIRIAQCRLAASPDPLPLYVNGGGLGTRLDVYAHGRNSILLSISKQMDPYTSSSRYNYVTGVRMNMDLISINS